MDQYSGIPVPSSQRGPALAGVRYITEDLIKKVTKQDSLDQITSLNLTLAKEGGKKIKYIENLEKLKKLQTLSLSCNVIEKIEKIDKLTKLRELNLSYNRLTKLENFETLTSLQVLNVTGNQIEHVPVWIGKKLKALRTFRIAKNKLQSLQELSKLRPLNDLTQLSVAENPVSQLPHCRLFLIFHMRTLETLDGQPVTTNERDASHRRFAQEEIQNLGWQLEKQEGEYIRLKEQHNKSVDEIKQREEKDQHTRDYLAQVHDQVRDLKRELETKDGLLKRKTAELTKACEKHYELEQELAFYKIDHKFDSLGKVPSSPDSGSIEDGLIGESPYIGKGRFKKNELARQRMLAAQQPSPIQHGSMDDSGQSMDQETRARMHQALDHELDDKHKAIDRAQERLKKLQQELVTAEENIGKATTELQRIMDAKPARSLTEDDKQFIRNKLVKKVNMVHQLRGEAKQIEAEMKSTQTEIKRQESVIDQLKGKLRRMGSKDSLYHVVKKEVADKEQELSISNQQYQELQRQLEGMLETIARETGEIKRLEQELREGQAAQNDAVKEELEGIISGLQTYLAEVKGQAANQKRDFDALLEEREDLLNQLRDMETDRSVIDEQAGELKQLYQRLADMEDSIEELRRVNNTLHHDLEETRLRDQDEADKSVEIQELEQETDQLKRELDDARRGAKAEKDALEKRLESEKRRFQQAANKVRELGDKEDEIRNLHKQLAAIQAANAKLQDQLYAEQQKMKNMKKQTVSPDDLRRRLDDITQALLAGKKAPVSKHSRDDQVGTTLGEFQDKVKQELDKSFKETERAKRHQSKMEGELNALKKKMADIASKEKYKAERAIQTQMEEEQEELERLKDELERLREELARKKDSPREVPIPVRLLEPTTRTATTTTTSTETASSATGPASDSESTSTVRSSQWSQRRQELYNSMTQDEQAMFDELQQEIADLRRLLGRKDKDAEKKAAEVQTKADKLQDMYRRRRESERSSQGKERRRGPLDTYRHEDPRLRQAASDLARAQEEIDELQNQLRGKNRQVRSEMDLADRSQHTVAAQQGEIDQLYDVLEEQRGEITRLNDVLEKLTGVRQDGAPPFDTEVQHLNDGLARIRNALAEHSPRVQSLGPRGATFRPIHQPEFSAYQDQPSPGGPPVVGPERAGVQPAYRPDPHIMQAAAQASQLAQYPAQHGLHPPQPYTADPYAMEQMVPPSAVPIAGPAPPGGGYIPVRGVPAHPQGGAVPGYAPQSAAGHVQHGGVPAGGQVYYGGGVPAGPTTPVGHRGQGMFSAPTTPVAGSGHGLGQVMPETPMGTHVQPMMMSTPMTPGLGDSSLGPPPVPIKGILKKGGDQADGEEELICTVPEHHDLEDYVAKLQAKVKSLRNKLKQHEEMSQSQNESRRVLFEGDKERKAIKRLQAELEERRGELEGLDLAIERQKGSLRQMKDIEKELVLERENARLELEALKMGRSRKDRRKTFLNGESQFEVFESDYDYEYNPKIHKSRRNYLLGEIECIEDTLAKRRAELREADFLLQECEADIIDTRKEARETLLKYDQAKKELVSNLRDSEEIEKRSHEAGVQLVKAEERLQLMQLEVESLRAEKEEQQQMLKDIEKVIGARDEEFQVVEAKLTEAKEQLQDVEKELEVAETECGEKTRLVQEADRMLAEKQDEIDRLHDKVAEERAALEEIDRQVGKLRVESDLLRDTINKRNIQLDSLDQELDDEIGHKRRKIKDTEMNLQDLQEEKHGLEASVDKHRSHLTQVQKDISQEEELLHTLATSTGKHKNELRQLQNAIATQKSEMDALRKQEIGQQEELQKVQEELVDEQRELEMLRAATTRKTGDLDHIRQRVDKEQQLLDKLSGERQTLEAALTSLRTEHKALKDGEKNLQQTITELKKNRGQIEETLHGKSSRLGQLKIELQQTQSQMDSANLEKAVLNRELQMLRDDISDHQSELQSLKDTLSDTGSQVNLLEEQEAERHHHTQENLSSLEVKVRELAKQIEVRNTEKEELATALSRSCEELQSLRNVVSKERDEANERIKLLETDLTALKQDLEDKGKELQNFKEKGAREMADLEGIAQAHYSRANRLSDELNYVRAEYMEVKRQLKSQEELEERETKLETTLRELKSDIKAEVAEGLMDMDRSRVEAEVELEQLHGQKNDLGQHLNALKHSLNKIKTVTDGQKGDGNSHGTRSDQLLQQQDYLKQQLRQQMSRHAEAIEVKRQLSEDTLHSLRRKLNNLEQVLSSSQSEPIKLNFHSQSTSMFQNGPLTTQEVISQENRPKRAYSPHRRSRSREKEYLVEKGPTT